MSLSQVVAALNGAISPTGQIDLYAASADPALTAIRPLLARFAITAAFPVAAASVSPAETSATLTGTANWGLPGAPVAKVRPVAVRLDCVAQGTAIVTFTLKLTMSQPDWTFDATFAGLPPTQMAQRGGVMPAASFLIGLRLNTAAFAAASDAAAGTGLTLTGSLPLANFWQPWKTLVGPWPLQLSGTVTVPASYDLPPLFDLLATATGSRIALSNPLLHLGGLALDDIGFGLISRPDSGSGDDVEAAYSVLALTGRIEAGALVARLSCPLLSTGDLWHFIVEFDEGEAVSDGELGALFGLPALPTPSDFLPIPSFRFQSIEFYVDSTKGYAVRNVAASIVSTQPWRSPAPFISLEDVGISWVWGATTIDKKPSGWLAASVFGTLVFETTKPIHIDAAVSIPGWSAMADLREGDVIPIGEAFRKFFGDSGPPTESDMNIVGLGIEADPQEQSFYAYADIIFGQPPAPPELVALADGSLTLDEGDPPEPEWTIDLSVTPIKVAPIKLQGLSFHIGVVAGEVSGGISATFLFGQGEGVQPAAFMLSAEYPGAALTHPEGWTFAGDLLPGAAIDLTALIASFLGQNTVPVWVPQLKVDRLYFRFNSGTRKAYAFGGTVSAGWQPKIFGTEVKISAAVALDMAKPGTSQNASGVLQLAFTINRLQLGAGLTLGVPEPVYSFVIKFGDGAFKGVTSWRGEGDKRHQVITLQLTGITIGGILEYLVNLAAPTIGYTLDPPWNVLNQIELSRFTLTLDPQESTVELVYAANADLVFMRLDTIGVRYTRGARSGVSLILTGSMLGQNFDGDDLAWDVIDESPPKLPGGGERFIRLRYLGLGQRVELYPRPDTVADTLKQLEQKLTEPKRGEPEKNPLDGQGVRWSPESQWLIGLDIKLLETLDLGIILNDPWLYGLSIALGGDKAGSLAGLRFEILYKKISDSVGMFRIELTLPEAFRTFEFGAVSVTLGTVVIEIYTNGNFRIDLGFPYNRNYARSFTVQVFPFLGRGGIYFGLLNGTTSRRVPRITNGNFSPVIELGVGLAVGVGKEVRYGPLSGGIYVELEVIFEGVLGWFHPSAAGGDTEVYYRAQGVAAIHGKLYGSVDFKVIKVSVTLEAYAAATVTLEAHRPTLFRLEVSVSAEAEITILFVTVSFSFEVDLDVSFEVGQESTPPWILSADQSEVVRASSPAALALGVDSHALRASRAMPRGAARRRLPAPARRPERRLAALYLEHQARSLDQVPNWQPTKKVFDYTTHPSPRTAALTSLPSFTAADIPLSWTATAPVNSTPRYRFALQLFAPTGVSSHALNAAQAKARSAVLSSHAVREDDLDALAADTLVRGLLLYAIYAIPKGPASATDPVTAGQLTALGGILNDPVAASGGFAESVLADFFNTNIHLGISGVPGGKQGDKSPSAMAMALPPFLSWDSPQTRAVDFGSDNKIGPLYIWGAQKAAAASSPSGTPPPGPPDDPLSEYRSFASHLFSDWCLLIARSAVREALAALDNRVLAVAIATQTLKNLADGLPRAEISYAVRPGDTITTVADAVGATVEELIYLNPTLVEALKTTTAGGAIKILLGVSPEVLALDNPTAPLQKQGLPLGDMAVPAVAADTLNILTARYGTTDVAILGAPGQDADAKLLGAGRTFDAPATTWTAAPAGFTALRAAAVFYIRYAGVPFGIDLGADAANWYAQALAGLELNRDIIKNKTDPRTQELQPGEVLAIPTALYDATPVASGYTTVPGDTLARIGAALNLQQNQATSVSGPGGWPAFRDLVTGSGSSYSIPKYAGVAIAPGETLATLARRTIVNWVSNGAVSPVWSASWSGLAAWIGDASILVPLSIITVPGVTTSKKASYTFASLATAFGLTLTDVGRRLANEEGLVDGIALTVRHLPADTVASLVDRVAANALARIAHEASRFLFSGQQIPVPVPVVDQAGHVQASTTLVSPLFDQSRQQWNLQVDRLAPTAVALSLTLSAQKSWITFNSSTFVDETTDGTALAAHNPALAAGRMLPHGAIALTGTSDKLVFSFTNKQVLDAVPATGLAWLPYRAAEAIKVRADAPITYGMAQHVALQTAIPLPIPGFDVAHATLSLHPFPAALLARARPAVPAPKDVTPTGYDVFASVSGTADAKAVANCTFATLIGFTIRRLPETPGVYQLVGAAVDQLPLLLDLIDYLNKAGPADKTVAKLTLPPAVTAADPNGLAVLDGDAWLIKSNLSTETVPPSPGVAMDVPPTPLLPLCRASLATPADFALLLWEGSSVGGIGYSFAATGGIGDGTFDASDQATLHLLVIAGEQQVAPPPTGRTLLAFNTSLIAVDQGIADGAILFAEAYQSKDPKKPTDPSEFIAQALVPAGSTGLTMTLTRPIVPVGGGDDEDALRQQYSLLAVTAASATNCPYVVPNSALPAPPQATDGTGRSALERAQARRRGEQTDPAPKLYWSYQSVLPVCRFGPDSLAPDVDGLPPPADDPYRGVGGATKMPQVNFQLGFGDVLGNRTAAANNAPLPVDVGYTDPLKGPTGWPAVSASYAITTANGNVSLLLNFAAKAQALMPALQQRGDALVETAKRQRDDYATVYYQYVQPALTVTAETTLQTGTALTLAGVAGLGALAGGSYLTAAGATLYAAVHPAAGLLSAIVSSYGIGWDMLATVNAAVPLSKIFGSGVPLTVPAYAVMASGDTANSVAAAAAARAGWPSPNASAILTASANADHLPLRLGAVLPYTARAVTLPDAAPTLASAAASFATSAGWLAADSAADPILVAHFAFVVDGVTVTVGTTPVPGGNNTVATIADAVAAFTDLGVHISAYELGLAYADVDGLLTAGAAAHAAHYVVASSATLGSNPSGATTADLIASNLATADLYEAGALIYLGDFGSGPPPTVTPADTDTLAGFASRYACPPAALLHANGGLAVISDTCLAIPGAVALPPSAAIDVPYTIRPTDTLAGIAANFDLTAPDKAAALAQRNRNMPGTVTQGLTFDVTAGTTVVPVNTTGLGSFAAVLAKVQVTAPAATMADVAAAFGTAGRLAAGCLLLCPPALMASAAAPSAITPRYGVSATAFALANGGVAGLLAPGVTLAAPDSAPIQTAANDTLNSVVGRFNIAYLNAGKSADLTIAALIAANPDAALFAAQARALLPPADIALTTPLSASGPYLTPGAAFPIVVELTVARPNALVHTGFRGTAVEAMRAAIAAPAAASPGGSMTFDAFAAALVAALPNLRLATAKLPNHAADLWAVDFGSNGITSVKLTQGVTFGADKTFARMIGLAPLYGQLVSRARVPIAPLAQGRLDPAAAVKQDYQAIDVEIWAARFLADFDRLLGAAPAVAIDAIPTLRLQFARLIAAKATLQGAIPTDLASIFKVNPDPKIGPPIPRAVTDPKLADGLVEARRVFGAALGVSLGSAWATAAIVQYDAAVDSSWTRSADPAGTAALYGEALSKAGVSPDRPWRLAAGKVSLSDKQPFLTLPLSVSDPGAQKNVELDLTYATSNVEIHRKAVALAPGYTRSDWLAMTPVLDGTKTKMPAALSVDLGKTEVPIPLKAFPGLPLLVTQTGLADANEPATFAGAPLWSFRLVYAHEHAAQDQVGVTIDLNLSPPRMQALGVPATQDLFTALAQYVAVADELNGLLAGLTDATRQVAPTVLTAAVTSAADLATAVAGLWTTRLANGTTGSFSGGSDDWIASQTCPFHAVVTYQPGTRVVVSYTLSRLADAIGAGIGWPTVRCRKPDGGWTVFDVASTGSDSQTYQPHGGPMLVTEWPHFELIWPGLNVGAVQNARARLDVVRNADLLGVTGPATADRFVYRTATVTASDIVTPGITCGAALSMTGATLTAALQAAFDALFPPANRRSDLKLTLGLFYGYTLVAGPDPLVSELAAGLIPDITLDGATAATAAGALVAWQDRVKPTTAGGLWTVSLTLYSSFDPGKRALLTLDRMTYPLAG